MHGRLHWVLREEAKAFGVMEVDADRQLTDFVEKPAEPPCVPGRADRSLASMGTCIFNARYLHAELARDMADPQSSHDFGTDIIPRAVCNGCAAAQPFSLSCVGRKPRANAHRRDVGTIDSYWDANIDLTANDPQLNLYDTDWPISTHQRQLGPAKFVHHQIDRRGTAVESLVSGGSLISGSVLRSVLFCGARVRSYSHGEWSALLDVQVGRRIQLRRVVVDRGCHIPDGMVIGADAQADAQRFLRTDSDITLVTRQMLARLARPGEGTASMARPSARRKRRTWGLDFKVRRALQPRRGPSAPTTPSDRKHVAQVAP